MNEIFLRAINFAFLLVLSACLAGMYKVFTHLQDESSDQGIVAITMLVMAAIALVTVFKIIV